MPRKDPKKGKVTKADVDAVFEYWNSCKICVHRFMNQGMERSIRKILEVYPLDSVKEFISTYAEIFHDPAYVLDYKWSVEEFCGTKYKSFLPEIDPRKRYTRQSWHKKDAPVVNTPPPPLKTKRVQQWMAATKEEREKLREQWEKEGTSNENPGTVHD